MNESVTSAIADWIIITGVAPLIGWSSVLTYKILQIGNRSDDMATALRESRSVMVTIEKVIDDNTRAMRALCHYVRWLAKEQSGKEPPPPIEGDK